jgi:hypothetical protein
VPEVTPVHDAEVLSEMVSAFRRLEQIVGVAEKIPHEKSFVYRFRSKGVREALVQKLARVISGLLSVRVLIEHGFLQEAGVLYRTLDEMHEDIVFLASAEANDAFTDRHAQYLEAFYSESLFDREPGKLRIPRPNSVPRKKIRAHTHRVLGTAIDASTFADASDALGTAFSGYVHAASTNIMDMYGGSPPRFHIEGMAGSPHAEACERTLEHYMHRSLMAIVICAIAFRESELAASLRSLLDRYETSVGYVHPE